MVENGHETRRPNRCIMESDEGVLVQMMPGGLAWNVWTNKH